MFKSIRSYFLERKKRKLREKLLLMYLAKCSCPNHAGIKKDIDFIFRREETK